jgi:hypothetical protein
MRGFSRPGNGSGGAKAGACSQKRSVGQILSVSGTIRKKSWEMFLRAAAARQDRREMEGWNQAELHIALVYIGTKSGSDLQLGLIFIAGGRTRARIARFREH